MDKMVLPGTVEFDHHVDSRRVVRPARTIFYCLPGARRDGHDFIAELYEIGVRNFVVSKDLPALPNAHFFRVEDVLMALQEQAFRHRKKMSADVVAITGSNGKTTVKEWLYQLLKNQLSVHRSPASYNSQIGVALSILGMKSHHELAIIEAGISEKGEMARLERMIQPDFGIFTGIGSAHDAGFADRKEKEEEKRRLFAGVRYVIEAVEELPNLVQFPFSDPASVLNIRLIMGFIKRWNPKLYEGALSRLNTLERIKMRSEVKPGLRGNILIGDYYNADLEGLQNSFRVASEVEPLAPRILVASELQEIDDRSFWVQGMSALISKQPLKSVYLIGMFTEQEKDSLQHTLPVYFFSNTRELIESGVMEGWSNSVVILKGARMYGFEEVERELVRPQHGTRLEIDMDALLTNWHILAHHLGPDVKRLVMIKATAYGSGLIRMGRFYSEHEADYLGVAYPDEGVLLRENDISTPILVLNSDFHALRILQKYKLEPVASSLSQISLIDPEIAVDIHIELNTGMNRLGLDPRDLPELLTLLKDRPLCRVKSLMSHLSASDNPEKDSFSRKQVDLFQEMSQTIIHSLGYTPMLQMANSQGAIRLPWTRFDMVRLGMALYGESNSDKLALNPVHRFISQISQIRPVPAGTPIGYGADAVLDSDALIATVPVGYADGLPRSLGRGNFSLLIRGARAPIVGDVCMDMTMLDVTQIDGISVGEEVEIFGSHQRLGVMAARGKTIGYEILAHIGQRVSRVFING